MTDIALRKEIVLDQSLAALVEEKLAALRQYSLDLTWFLLSPECMDEKAVDSFFILDFARAVVYPHRNLLLSFLYWMNQQEDTPSKEWQRPVKLFYDKLGLNAFVEQIEWSDAKLFEVIRLTRYLKFFVIAAADTFGLPFEEPPEDVMKNIGEALTEHIAAESFFELKEFIAAKAASFIINKITTR